MRTAHGALLTHRMTSDEVFEAFRREKKECFDFIFIDGLHQEAQVHRDIATTDIICMHMHVCVCVCVPIFT